MATRSIVCLLEGRKEEESALRTAIALAVAERGHLVVVHASHVSSPPVSVASSGMFVDTELYAAASRQREEAMAAARAMTRDLCAAAGLAMDADAVPRATFAVVDATRRELGSALALCDLIVAGSERGDDLLARSDVEVAVFATRRPLLVGRPQDGGAAAPVPQGHCAIAFDGSPEAIHALIATRQLMERATAITLFSTARTDKAGPTRSQQAALDYLAAHEMPVSLEVVEAAEHSAAEAILERLVAAGSDYLVMGAYGHSVFREMVLGGFSEHMLRSCQPSLLICH